MVIEDGFTFRVDRDDLEEVVQMYNENNKDEAPITEEAWIAMIEKKLDTKVVIVQGWNEVDAYKKLQEVI